MTTEHVLGAATGRGADDLVASIARRLASVAGDGVAGAVLDTALARARKTRPSLGCARFVLDEIRWKRIARRVSSWHLTHYVPGDVDQAEMISERTHTPPQGLSFELAEVRK